MRAGAGYLLLVSDRTPPALEEHPEAVAEACGGPSHLAVEVAADGFLGPGLVVELSPALLLRVACHICHHLGGSSGVSPEPGPPPAPVNNVYCLPDVLVFHPVLPESPSP